MGDRVKDLLDQSAGNCGVQTTFDAELAVYPIQAMRAAPVLASALPSPLIGEADVKRMQSEGWSFAGGGVRLGGCWAVWAVNRGDRQLFFLADPEKYPQAWSEHPG